MLAMGALNNAHPQRCFLFLVVDKSYFFSNFQLAWKRRNSNKKRLRIHRKIDCHLTKYVRVHRLFGDKCFDDKIILLLSSLQGPLAEKSHGSWTATPVFEFYHMLPYAEHISCWLSRFSVYEAPFFRTGVVLHSLSIPIFCLNWYEAQNVLIFIFNDHELKCSLPCAWWRTQV